MNTAFYICLVLLAGGMGGKAAPAAEAPVTQVEDEDQDPISAAILGVGERTDVLSRDVQDMVKRSETGLTTAEMREACTQFYQEYQDLIDHIEQLGEVAVENGTDLKVGIEADAIWQRMDDVMREVRVSPIDLLQLVFRTGGVMDTDSRRLALSMSMLNQLSRLATMEAYFNLLQASSPEEVEQSLDNILAIAGAIVEVSNGILDTISEAETEAEAESKGEMDSVTEDAAPSKEDVDSEEKEVQDEQSENQPKLRMRRQLSWGLGGGWRARPQGLTWTNSRGNMHWQINHGLGFNGFRPSFGFRWSFGK